VDKSLPLISDSDVNGVLGGLHMHILILNCQYLFKLLRDFVASVVFSDVLLRLKVGKLHVLLTSHEHRTDSHFNPQNSLVSVLAAKSSLDKVLVVSDTVPDKLSIIGGHRSAAHFLSPRVLF
jgi:hypothetical protein